MLLVPVTVKLVLVADGRPGAVSPNVYVPELLTITEGKLKDPPDATALDVPSTLPLGARLSVAVPL